MRNTNVTKIVLGMPLAAALVAWVLVALPSPSWAAPERETSISAEANKDGVELSVEVDKEKNEEQEAQPGASKGAAWYENPMMVAIIAVGALALVVLIVLAVRRDGSSTTLVTR